jgi:hypothetical protein
MSKDSISTKIIRIPHTPIDPPEDGSIIICEPVECSFCSTVTTLAIVERYVIPSDGWCPHPLCPKHLKEQLELFKVKE